ncbi:MAG: flagellar basal body P-ring protein FlgI [Pirellulales bacterium]
MRPCYAWLVCGLLACSGCAAPALRSQSPEEFVGVLESKARLVGEVARPFGHTYVKVESVALVTGLDGTGEDPAPSPERAALLHELQTIGVQHPNQLLASPSTSLVLVRGFLPPGVRKGDKFDLEVQVAAHSETASLRDGWLMETRLSEMAVLGGSIREGHPWAVGEGPVLVDPSATGEKDRALLVRGRVLGGGTALRTRDIGLFIPPEDKSVRLAAQIGQSINHRFHTFSRGLQQGAASPKSDERIDLKIHSRYKDNIARYIRVVRSIPLKETPAEQSLRIGLLERQLLDPITAPTAALRLEAIGHEAIDALVKGIESSDPEVRFYAAEALAYLDDNRAAAPLARAAREEPAFRAYALAALSSMADMAARDELISLLEVSSSETRYGAFRALWAMNPNDALIRGENLGGQFGYHVLGTTGPAMIHVTRSYRPEVVIFGHEQTLSTPFVLEAGKSILVKGTAPDKVTVSKFAVGQPDQKRVVSAKVDAMIRAIVELGGTYPDVVQALQLAKSNRALAGRFEVDALPDGDRAYRHKDTLAEEPDAGDDEGRVVVANPLPDLFFSRKPKEAR